MSERLTDEQINQIESAANGMDSWVFGVTVIDLINYLRHYKKLAEERGAALTIVRDTLEHRKSEDRTSWSLYEISRKSLEKE